MNMNLMQFANKFPNLKNSVIHTESKACMHLSISKLIIQLKIIEIEINMA